ncbi:MAG: hypothetical protein FWC56_05900 [Phycisphaerae bacterium]|nr:hypothetical protein [Phycisphaerae bacterium]
MTGDKGSLDWIASLIPPHGDGARNDALQREWHEVGKLLADAIKGYVIQVHVKKKEAQVGAGPSWTSFRWSGTI